jgi:hypothetical protein
MKHLLSLLLLAVLCSGCVHTYTARTISRTGPLSTNTAALVALPEDGRFEKIPYPGSGRKAALAVSKAFSKHLRSVDVTAQTDTLAKHLEQARAGKFDYLIVPTIIHWEDRATEWSGRSDRIEIEVRAVDVPSEKTLSLGSVTGKSKWATFGGDVPEDLLPVPLGVYVDWLFSPEGTSLPLPKAEPEHITQPAYTGRGVGK